MPIRNQPDDEEDYSSVESNHDQEIAKLLQEREKKLIELEREKELIAREKEKLERIKKRRIEFKQGQGDLTDKFTRALIMLDRSETTAKKNIEQMLQIREAFEESLGEIKAIDPEDWSSKETESELSKALSRIEHAKLVYNQSKIEFESLADPDGGNQADEDEDENYNQAELSVTFGELLRRGFALSLPLIITLIAITWIIVTALNQTS